MNTNKYQEEMIELEVIIADDNTVKSKITLHGASRRKIQEIYALIENEERPFALTVTQKKELMLQCEQEDEMHFIKLLQKN